MLRGLIAPQLEAALRTSLRASELQLVELDGERTAHDDEAQPWNTVKYGPAGHDDWFGVVPAVAQFRRASGSAAESLPLIVKINARESLARTFMPWFFEQLRINLDRPYWRDRQAAEFENVGGRESQVYRVLAGQVAGLEAVLPKCYGSARDSETTEEALFLEKVADIRLMDASGASFDWPAEAIDKALRALADWQAAFGAPTKAALRGRDRNRRRPIWRPTRRSGVRSSTMAERACRTL